MRLFRRLSGPMVAAAAMAVLLGVMAVLQYRWVGQLSADERDRTRAHLHRRADAFADDFNRELTRTFFWLQVGPDIRRDESDDGALRALVHHRAAPRSRQGDLSPEDRCRRSTSRDDRLELEVFERAPARLAPAPWPSALAPVRDRVTEAVADHRKDESRPVRLPLVWSDIPALLVPMVRIGDRGAVRLPAPGQRIHDRPARRECAACAS